nr:replication protein A 70 kDa DNA-binding subunit D-like [Ipomoea batatas]
MVQRLQRSPEHVAVVDGAGDENSIKKTRENSTLDTEEPPIGCEHFKILPRGGWRQSVAARDILVAAHQGRWKQRRPLASICWTVAARLLLARRRRTGKRRRSTELLRRRSHTAVVAACYVEKERGREGRGPPAALSTATGSLAAAGAAPFEINSMAPMYVLVEELDKDHTSVAIRLRAVRTYNVRHSRGRDQIKSRECVFHDEAGSYVHLHIPGKSVSPKNDFVEGNVYCIKIFLVVAHWYCYKTCEGEYMMKVFSETLIKPYKGCDFPRYMYRLKPFEVLNTLDANILVDVIGRVVEIYSPLEKMINGRPSRLIDFVIEDLKGYQVKCNVWDDHVEKVKPFFKSDLLDPVVVLIQMGRIKLVEKSGEVKICSSYDATKLLFNENTLEFVEFRNSLSMQQQTPLKSITSNSTFSYGTTSRVESSTKMQITTLSEIFSKREIGDFWVPCKIIGIESDPNDWYYDSCPKPNCNKKLELNSRMYDCGKCGGRFVKGTLRYKLKIRVVDVNGTAPLLLWDREVLELLCLKADELKAMQPSVMTKVPKDIRNLKGRGLFFKISVKSETFDKLDNAVPVLQVKHFPEMFETYCPGLIQHNDDEFSSKLQLTQDDSDSDEGFFSDDPIESPIAATSGKQDEAGNETEAVKRSLLDEFSSTQPSKKKKDVVVKMEDEKEQDNTLSILYLEDMKKLTRSTVLGTKRKGHSENKGPSRLSNDLIDKNRTPLQDISVTVNMNRERENENSIQDENVIGSKHNRLSSIQTPKQLFGVFQSSLVTPLSVLTEGPSRLSNDLIDKTRAPLQDIPATVNMNRERDSSFQSISSTITNAMRSSTMEFRNLNNDFEEDMKEQDLTNNESIC